MSNYSSPILGDVLTCKSAVAARGTQYAAPPENSTENAEWPLSEACGAAIRPKLGYLSAYLEFQLPCRLPAVGQVTISYSCPHAAVRTQSVSYSGLFQRASESPGTFSRRVYGVFIEAANTKHATNCRLLCNNCCCAVGNGTTRTCACDPQLDSF